MTERAYGGHQTARGVTKGMLRISRYSSSFLLTTRRGTSRRCWQAFPVRRTHRGRGRRKLRPDCGSGRAVQHERLKGGAAPGGQQSGCWGSDLERVSLVSGARSGHPGKDGRRRADGSRQPSPSRRASCGRPIRLRQGQPISGHPRSRCHAQGPPLRKLLADFPYQVSVGLLASIRSSKRLRGTPGGRLAEASSRRSGLRLLLRERYAGAVEHRWLQGDRRFHSRSVPRREVFHAPSPDSLFVSTTYCCTAFGSGSIRSTFFEPSHPSRCSTDWGSRF